MGLIPQNTIEDVLARTDLVQTVQKYVSLKRAGTNMKGLCPFHAEKTPSFNVHPQKQIYKCFGCGAGGNVLGFLMAMEGWNFPEAVRYLAEQHGIEVPEDTEEEQEAAEKRRKGKKQYQRIMGLALSFFEEQLWSTGGRAAQQYLAERGVDEDTARAFHLGFAPKGWQNLLDTLGSQDVPPPWAERAGLAIRRNEGEGFYDRFRHRVMFPIIDIWGHATAFGGRVFAANDDSPKYINSPETAFYKKGRELYGLHAAKSGIQSVEWALLVEGNFDVVVLHGAGLNNTVAPMGTAVTDQQAKLLSRYCRRVVIAFDGDSAGQEATLRCLGALQKAGIDGHVVTFDQSDDPDSFVRRNGADALRELCDQAPDIVQWAIDRALPRAERGDVRQNIHGLEAAGDVLRLVQNDVARERYAQEISRRLAIEPRLLTEYIGRPQEFGDRVKAAVIAAQEPVKLERAEFGILAALLDHPEWLGGFVDEEYEKLLSSVELADFLHLAHTHYQHHEGLEPAVLLASVEHGGFRRTVEDALVAPDSLYKAERSRRFFDDCVRRLKRNWADRTLVEILGNLEEVDFGRDRDAFEALVKQQQQVEQFKRSLER